MIEKISYEEVNQIASTIKNGAERMRQILNETSQNMQNVNQDDTWKSNAAGELYAKFKELETKFEGFYTEIENYSKFLTQTVETYQAADAAIANASSNLAS